MKVAGFSFIRNAVRFDYPIAEALLSITPLCDAIYVAVGNSEDDTLAKIQALLPEKIRILETIWDDGLREGGRVLAVETDKIFQFVPPEYDWCIYIQGDEVLHEAGHPEIKEAMQCYMNTKEVDGFLLKYHHFYGSYDYLAESSNFYRNEIRIIRNNKQIYSYRDAQGFRKNNNEKLQVIPLQAYMHHYGWVRQPKAMQDKQLNFNKLWHDDSWIEEHVVKADEFDYGNIQTITLFKGTHPTVMQQRIQTMNWKFDYDISRSKYSFKDVVKRFLFRWFGIDLNYKNYILLKLP